MTTTVTQPTTLRHRRDPILAELWEIKAAMNAEANYDVKQLLENAHKTVDAMKVAGVLAMTISNPKHFHNQVN